MRLETKSGGASGAAATPSVRFKGIGMWSAASTCTRWPLAGVAFPARLTYRRAGPVRVSGSGMNNHARCSAAGPSRRRPDTGHQEDVSPVRTGVSRAEYGAHPPGRSQGLSRRQATHRVPPRSSSRLRDRECHPSALAATTTRSRAASRSARSRSIAVRKATLTQMPRSLKSKRLACLRPKMSW